MTAPKDGESFFRKVARFVANPTTDWAELNSRQDDPEADAAKAELRAMVERKRRNDFVRKRELDMLRRIRREGLTPEQLAALGGSSSRIDEMERGSGARNSGIDSKLEQGLKAKIDQIEQQMAGEGYTGAPPQQAAHPPGFFETSTRPIHFASTTTEPPPAEGRVSEFSPPEEAQRLVAPPPAAAATMGAGMSPPSNGAPSRLPDLHFDVEPSLSFKAAEHHPAPPPPVVAAPPGPELPMPPPVSAPAEPAELVHDAELDNAVIAFANADYDSCERDLVELTKAGGPRNLHAETWLVLFDLYRATGQAAKFETLANEYAQQFGLSAPQYFSMPKLVAEAARSEKVPHAKAGGVSWTAPEQLNIEAIIKLEQRCQMMPLPWVLDWSELRSLDADSASRLRELFRSWAGQPLDIRWMSGDQFLQQLKDLAPVAVRDTDAAFWMLRLEALRLVNRPDQFDEAAIDYCVTYEVSPPSWEPTKCRVRVGGQSLSTAGMPPTTVHGGEPTTSFMESQITEMAQLPAHVQLELSGQLSGDITETLKTLSSQLGASTTVLIHCPLLIRLDFMAAGDLLNWVLTRRSENRAVIFVEAHRLVALFFGAMGINEHARVKVRQV
ncbi:hypothetical protein [Pelomonas sp. SE-A7]|uniref:hypothetical protein n=1 Tax=Pelomonas sp. SE-A7 TaxID=3054953 RepID=UPI00259C8BA9|nr:hypothetical protein [Pelomonas sp. SE-A7]MDM4767905.1 hypothetical protein [Pelomonas sp. SE-A7]